MDFGTEGSCMWFLPKLWSGAQWWGVEWGLGILCESIERVEEAWGLPDIWGSCSCYDLYLVHQGVTIWFNLSVFSLTWHTLIFQTVIARTCFSDWRGINSEYLPKMGTGTMQWKLAVDRIDVSGFGHSDLTWTKIVSAFQRRWPFYLLFWVWWPQEFVFSFSLFCDLYACCISIGAPFFRLGKFSSRIWLKIISGLLSCEPFLLMFLSFLHLAFHSVPDFLVLC